MTALLESPAANPAPIPTDTPRRRPRWPSGRYWDAVLPAALVLLTAVLRLLNLAGTPQRVDDEGTYVAQAYAVSEFGELAHYTYWYDHPPLGWIQIALWTMITGGPADGQAVVAARGFMVALAAVAAALLWVLCRRLGLSRWAAAGAGVLFALSPLAVQFGKTVYLDNIALVWLLAALVCLSSPRQRLSAAFGGALCYGIAVLTKETMLLLLPAVAWLAWGRAAPSTRRYVMSVLGAVFCLAVAGYLLAAAIRSELLPGVGHVSLVDAIRFQLWKRAQGGGLLDPSTDNGRTLVGWLALDPVLPALAIPAGLAGLWVRTLRPIAAGVLTLCAVALRPGYLPVPFVIVLLPLVALLVAGTIEWALRHGGERGDARLGTRPLAVPAALAAVLVAAVAVPAWTPTLRYLATADADAPLQQAQAWVEEYVPTADRIVVDDALWVDLVRDGRDRRDVVWFYKLDTDSEVQAWSPDGWRDYDWVISTQQVRTGAAVTGGQLAAALAAGRPVATFGTGETRVDVLRIDHGDAPASSGDGSGLATALADRLAETVEPEAAEMLRTGRADPRVVGSLTALSASEDLRVAGLPAVDGEDAAEQPRRQVELTATGESRDRIAAFFRAQVGPYATEAVLPSPTGLVVRFPVGDDQVTLPAPAAAGGASARVRVIDMRPTSGAGGQAELIRYDGRAMGGVPLDGYGTPSGYRTVPAGSYLVGDRADPRGPLVLRQAVRVEPGRGYTLTLFDAAGGDGGVNAQFAADEAPAASRSTARVRLLEGARGADAVTLSVASRGSASPIVLADGVGYGLVTGYAQVPAGRLATTVTSGGRTWTGTVDVPGGAPSTLVVVDSPDGPTPRLVRDAGAAVRLDPAPPRTPR